MFQSKDLSGKVGIVTGSGSGIGKAVALSIAKEGARVTIADLNAGEAERTVSEIVQAGGEALAVSTDVSDSAQVKKMVEAALLRYGTVDFLVNAAGIGSAPSVSEVTEEEWNRVIAVNLNGTFLTCKAVIGHMTEKKTGRIVNFASGQWFRPVAAAAYAASKGGVVSLSKSLALEAAPHGINVNVVVPGFTDTPMTRRVFPSDEVFDMVAQNPSLLGPGIAPPRGQIANTEDIVEVVLFLLKPESRHVTGQTIHVNGGSLMW